MRKFQNIGDKLIPIIFILTILVLWELVVNLGVVERYILPAPTDIVRVSVTAASAFEAEVVAKHLLILGSELAQTWAQRQADVGVCMVLEHGQTRMNAVFEQQIMR